MQLDLNDPFEAAVADIVGMNRKKRNDYTVTAGDAFWNFERSAEQCGLTREQGVEYMIATKQARLRALTTSGRTPANEPISDTVLDRAVYSVIAYAMIRQNQGI